MIFLSTSDDLWPQDSSATPPQNQEPSKEKQKLERGGCSLFFVLWI